MKRSMMQVYVKGSDKAVALYQKAFDAKLVSSYQNPDGTFFHSELDVYGQILSVAELNNSTYGKDEEGMTGNTMQFCLHFGEGKEDLVKKAVEILTDGAKIFYPLSPTDYSPLLTDFVDQFGVRWCIFV